MFSFTDLMISIRSPYDVLYGLGFYRCQSIISWWICFDAIYCGNYKDVKFSIRE